MNVTNCAHFNQKCFIHSATMPCIFLVHAPSCADDEHNCIHIVCIVYLLYMIFCHDTQSKLIQFKQGKVVIVVIQKCKQHNQKIALQQLHSIKAHSETHFFRFKKIQPQFLTPFDAAHGTTKVHCLDRTLKLFFKDFRREI